MKIKIIKCKDERFFYHKRVGEVIEVEAKTATGYRFLCKNNTYGYISLHDAIEVNE